RRRQLLFELKDGDPLAFAGGRHRLLVAAQTERQGFANSAAGGDGHRQAAEQSDFQGFVHANLPEGVKSRTSGRGRSGGSGVGRSRRSRSRSRRGGRRQGRSGLDDGGQAGRRAGVDRLNGRLGALTHRVGHVLPQLQLNEGLTRLSGLAVLQLRHRQRFLGERLQRALVASQRLQTLLHVFQRTGVHHQEGGLQRGHVRQDRIARRLGGFVEQGDGFSRLLLGQRQTALLHQGQDLIAAADLGGLGEGGVGFSRLARLQGFDALFIGGRGLVGLRAHIGLPAPPGQRRDQGDRQNAAQNGQP